MQSWDRVNEINHSLRELRSVNGSYRNYALCRFEVAVMKVLVSVGHYLLHPDIRLFSVF